MGTTMPSLNNSVMNALVFPEVGDSEQDAICLKLKAAENYIDALEASRLKLNNLKLGLMTSLLTGCLRLSPEELRAQATHV